MAGVSIRVYLLDDHEIVRRGLRELLESAGDMEVVGESGLAMAAARQVPALRPDVAIFDARLPDGSGIDACREVRSVDPSIKALVLTSYDDEQALATAILAGASGFLLKNIKGNGLIEAIRRVAAGENLIDPASSDRLLERWQVGEVSEVTELTDHRLRLLTPQEQRILDLIAAGMTNREIGAALALAEKTVKNYVTSVLGKLAMTSRTQAAVFAATRPHPERHR